MTSPTLHFNIFCSNLAECYSGDGALETYKSDGPSRQCFTSKYKPCSFECEDQPCVGTEHTLFVYKLGERECLQKAHCIRPFLNIGKE